MPAGDDKRSSGPIRWPRAASADEIESESAVRHASLLDLDEDLAQECDPRTLGSARALTIVKVCEAPAPLCDLQPWFAEVGLGPGLLILDGVVAVNICVGDRAACELVGGGDLIQRFEPRAEELVSQHESCQSLVPTSFALLDEQFAARSGVCPQVTLALLRRAARRASEAETLRAIASHPRLEVRLALLLWHLASRWGKVGPGGIRLALPLTHRLLGQLVAAERPSVSHALHRLSQTGLVTGASGELLLHGSLDDHLEALRVPLTERGEQRRLGAVRAGQLI